MFNLNQAIVQAETVNFYDEANKYSLLFSYLDILIGVFNYYNKHELQRKKKKQRFVDATGWAIDATKGVMAHNLKNYRDKRGPNQLNRVFHRGASATKAVDQCRIEIDNIKIVAIITQEMCSLIDDLLCEEGKLLMLPVYDYTDNINNVMSEPSDAELATANRFVRKIKSIVNDKIY